MKKAGISVGTIIGAFLLALVVLPLGWGQFPDIPDKGFRPFGSYQLSDIDSVNLATGNLVLHIPIVSYPQRGNVPSLSLSVRYNNPRWAVRFQYGGVQQYTGADIWWARWGDDGAGTEIVRDNAYSMADYQYNIYVIDPFVGAAVLHAVDSMGAHHVLENTAGDPNVGFGSAMESIDGTGLRAEGTNSLSPTIIDGNGVRHMIPSIHYVDHPFPPDNAGNEDQWAYQIATDNSFGESTEDANGNKITALPGQGWTDTMGRFIPAPNQSRTGCETLNFPGPNGGASPITFCYGGVTVRSSFGLTNVADDNFHNFGYALLQLISSITLANGTSWQFHYNNFGFLTSITLPSGGTISYTWNVSSQCAAWLQMMRNRGGGNEWSGDSEVCDFTITNRTFDAHDGSAPQTWTYSPGPNNIGFQTVTVTDPKGDDSVHTFAWAFDNAPYEIKTQYYNGPQSNNQLVKTIDTEYPAGYLPQPNQPYQPPGCGSYDGMADNLGRGPVINPISKTTTWAANNQVSKTTFTYDSGATVLVTTNGYNQTNTCPLTYGKVIQESEYDYGSGAPGPLLRTTNTQYQAFHDSNYLAKNLLNLPYSVQITDGSGNQVAYSYNEYDQTGLQPSGVSTQFDTNPPGAPYRGNLTTAHRWLNTTGTYLNTTSSYYDTGMPYQATDAKNNTTTLSYDLAFAGAYVTKMQMPTTASNGVQHIIQASYDFNTGLKTSSTDQNQQTTNYTYDTMGRVKSVTGPPDPNNGGQSSQTIYNYYDLPAVSLPEVEVQQNIDGRQTDSLTLFDGAGRATRTATKNDEDPNNPYEQVDTCFDGMGQKYFTSYPYRSTGFNATKACSNSQRPGDTFTLDAVGRVTQITNADGSVMSTDYSQFPTVTVADQAGNQQRNRTDALGHLLEVDEPGGSPASAASGSLTINGTLQSFAAGPQQATSGHVELTFSGQLQSKSSCSPSGQPCSDSGSISITVAGVTKSVNYPYPGYTGTDSGGSIQALANAFHTDTTSPVDAIYYGADESGNIVMDLIARAKGAATNYPLSTSVASNDSRDFPSPSFQVSVGSHLIGGQDATGPATSGHASLSFSGALLSKASCSSSGGQPCADSGSIGTTVTTSAGRFSKSVPYSSSTGNNSSQAVQALANAFHLDANSPVDAFFTSDESGNYIMNLTARATGAATNYQLSTSIVSNDPTDFLSPSFQVSAPSLLAGGKDATNSGTVFDSGVVYATVRGGFTVSAPFGQGSNSTAAMVATALANGLNATDSPVTATASGSTIALNYKTPGAAGNTFVGVMSSSYDPSNPSFTSLGVILSGGVDLQLPSLSTPAVTLYSYDTLDNLVGVQQQGNSPDSSQWRQRSYLYDSLSRLRTAISPESGTINYGYDANGNVISKVSSAPNQTSAGSITYSYAYDELNRLLARSSTGQPAETYTYDVSTVMATSVHNPIGRPVMATSSTSAGTVTTIYSYDVMGRTEFETEYPNRSNGSLFRRFSYAYNLDGSLKSITYPSGRVISYAYNITRRPFSVVDNNGTSFAANAHYTPWGALSSVVNGSMTTTNSYNLRMQPVFLSASSPSQTILNLGYDFNSCNGNGGNNGNVCQSNNNKIGQSARSQSFQYDALNRLLAAISTNWSQNYAYDNWANLLQKNVAGGDTPLNVKVNSKNQVTNWCYDAAGNVVGPNPCSSYANGVFAAIYDGENRMTQATVGNVTTSYDYDADGRRVKKSGGVNTLYWYGSDGKVLEETDLSGTLQNEYIFFGGKRVARYSVANGYSYFFSDHLGSASVVTDALGNTKEESDYYPYGGERVVTDLGIGNNYKFTGKERDPETGLDYFGARYYGSAIGRFTTTDPMAASAGIQNPQTLNRYTYALNNPVRMIDPTGKYSVDVHLYLTDVLAQAAGYSRRQAHQIAEADENIDVNPKTNPLNPFNFGARRDWHFTSQARRDELWGKFEESRNLTDLGSFFHPEQDSYSHKGFGWFFGHLFAGHEPDITKNDPEKADNMAKDTLDKLHSAQCQCSSEDNGLWNAIAADVDKFNKDQWDDKDTKKQEQKLKDLQNIQADTWFYRNRDNLHDGLPEDKPPQN